MPQQRVMELNWQNGQILVVDVSKRSPEQSHDYDDAIDLQFQNEDEMYSLLPHPPDKVSELYYPIAPAVLSTPYSRDELVAQAEFASTSVPLRPVHPVNELEPEPRVVLVADNTVQVSCGKTRSGGIEFVKSPLTSSMSLGLGGIGSAGAEPSKNRMSATEDLKQKGIEANDEPSKKRTSTTEDLKRKGIEANYEPSRTSVTDDLKRKGIEVNNELSKKRTKRKGIEANEDECYEVVEIESRSSKRSRDAKMHNTSERERRDRINKYMKALQELIPGYNKNDKSSMLLGAIEYVKALQLQLQMVGTSTGLGINVGMNPTMVPFPYVPGGYPAAAVPHMPPRFYMPPYLMQPPPDPSRIQQTNQFAALHYAQAASAQNQEAVQPYTYNNREAVDPKNHQSGRGNSIFLSIRPGRRRAGSRLSILLVLCIWV